MENILFNSFIVEEYPENNFSASFQQKSIKDLPQGDVIINVHYSSLNYKDALVYRGHKGIARKYPHTPGIDAAGIVVESQNNYFNEGDQVVVTGYDLGMNTSGGFQEYIRIPSNWIVPLPAELTLKESMIYGTAGFTAGLAIHRLQSVGIFPDSGKILVTGATGGVGVLAIALLNKIGYEVIASTGKTEMSDFLRKIGANEIIHRNEILDSSNKPLLGRRWKGVIENVGGQTLTSVIKATDKEGAVAIIGNVSGDSFNMSVYPFILRGVALLGIESAETDYSLRLEIWNKLSMEWRIKDFEAISKEILFSQIPEELEKMLKGMNSKKTVLKIS